MWNWSSVFMQWNPAVRLENLVGVTLKYSALDNEMVF